MRKMIITFAAILLLFPITSYAATKTKKPAIVKKVVTKKNVQPVPLAGNFFIEKETPERLWYINSSARTRYWLRNDAEAMQYVHPADKKRYSLRTTSSLLDAIKPLAKISSRKNIALVAINKDQQIFDPLFSGVAYVSYDGAHFSHGSNDTRILPLASLTKLMTALVLLDTSPDWKKPFTLTPAVIDYPRTIIPQGGTSEINFKEGDTVTLEDLRVALLVASSNQSAVALADATGLSREEFIGRMNEKTKLFGLTHTVFYDIAGLDPRNVSTPREMAIIAQQAFAHDLIASTSVTTDYTITATEPGGTLRTIPVINRNTSLLAFDPEGAKSGYLVEAQRNAVIRKDGKILIVMHARSLDERNSIIGKLLALAS